MTRYTFTFDIKRVSLDLRFGRAEPFFLYTHENGYVQARIGDDSMGEVGSEYHVSLISQFQDFRDMLARGGNALYAAYAMLPSEYIDGEGKPVIDLDFEDAHIYLETGVLPSAEKLTANAQSSGVMMVDDVAVQEMLDSIEDSEEATPEVAKKVH